MDLNHLCLCLLACLLGGWPGPGEARMAGLEARQSRILERLEALEARVGGRAEAKEDEVLYTVPHWDETGARSCMWARVELRWRLLAEALCHTDAGNVPQVAAPNCMDSTQTPAHEADRSAIVCVAPRAAMRARSLRGWRGSAARGECRRWRSGGSPASTTTGPSRRGGRCSRRTQSTSCEPAPGAVWRASEGSVPHVGGADARRSLWRTPVLRSM